MTNVATGRISATSTDAVNGSELYATNQQVGANTAAIKNLSSSVNNIVSRGANNRYYQANTTGVASSATGVNALAAGPAAVAQGNSSMAMGAGATTSAENGIAIGAGASSNGADSVAIGAGSTDAGESNVVSVGSSAQQRRITHVAAGNASTDAVNVSQLDAAQYGRDSDGNVDYGDVTLGANGSAAQIHGVANGAAPSDAANLGQLSAGIQSAENWAKNYTDQRLQGIDQSLNTVAARANAGVASAMAMAELPQAYRPNQNAAAMVFGTFHGQAGMAVGMSTVSESGRWVYKLNVTGNTRGDAGASVWAAVTW